MKRTAAAPIIQESREAAVGTDAHADSIKVCSESKYDPHWSTVRAILTQSLHVNMPPQRLTTSCSSEQDVGGTNFASKS